MIDDEIDRRAHFVITETPSTVLHTGGPTHRASHGHVVVVVVVAASASALSPCHPGSVRGQMTDGTGHRAGAEGRCHLVAPAPALSRICVCIVHLCSKIGPDVQHALVRRYLTRLEKGGRK